MNTSEKTLPDESAAGTPAADAQGPGIRPPDQADGLDVELQAVKPASGIGHARMRASLKEKLFGAPQEPIRLGRFVLMDRLGQGGMGVVYSAYDPALDRRVALKLLHTGEGQASQRAKDRLLREAQALARLSHPNVVPVYEVGVLEEQVFIVMEFVVGQTLRQWAAPQERQWHEVLDAYRQAGQGLAAAHAVGLVHRDFKPDNVQVGEDRRIRVLDFGLAGLARGRWADEPDEEPVARPASESEADIMAFETTASMPAVKPASGPASGPASRPASGRAGTHDSGLPGELPSNKRLHTPLTATGALLGTPAYMPPEQFAGAKAGPASDQFSFCVSLYEGLYRQRPFAGDNLPALQESVRQGQVRPPPRNSRVPRWIFPILCRGMALKPAERHPSMDALLAELGRDPARTRKRRLLAVLIAVLIGVSIYSFIRARSAVSTAGDVCQGASRELAGIWDANRRAALTLVFSRTGRAYATQAWTRIAAGLNRYAGSWTAMHEHACRAHQRGEQSGALLDKRMACLQRRKQALASAIAVLQETTAESLQHSVEVMQKLPAMEHCGDLEALAAEVPPPEDPAVAGRVAALRERLSRAKALEDAGRYTDALALATALAGDAELLAYRPLQAEVLLLHGRIAMALRDGSKAVASLHQATALGLATGMTEVALEALARSIFAEGTLLAAPGQDPGQVLRPVYIAEALLERLPKPTFVHALLLNNTGVVHLARGARDQARQAFERALDIKRREPGTTYVELSVIQSNLALVTPDPAERDALLDSASQELEQALGPAHPGALERRMVHSYYILEPARARRIVAATCGLYEQYHPELHRQLAECLYWLGILDAELGERASAAEHFSTAVEHFPQNRQAWFRDLARGHALLYQGDPRAALAALDAAIQALGQESEHWWHKKQVAEALLVKGMSLQALGQDAAAIAALEQARDGFERVMAINQNVETQRRLARTWSVLATALWGAGRADQDTRATRARAAELMARALAWYRTAGPGNEQDVKESEAWLHRRGLDERAAGQK